MKNIRRWIVVSVLVLGVLACVAGGWLQFILAWLAFSLFIVLGFTIWIKEDADGQKGS